MQEGWYMFKKTRSSSVGLRMQQSWKRLCLVARSNHLRWPSLKNKHSLSNSNLNAKIWVCLKIRCPFLVPKWLFQGKKGHLILRPVHMQSAGNKCMKKNPIQLLSSAIGFSCMQCMASGYNLRSRLCRNKFLFGLQLYQLEELSDVPAIPNDFRSIGFPLLLLVKQFDLFPHRVHWWLGLGSDRTTA